MNRKNTRNTRDLGFGGSHSAGKGDAPRNCFSADYRARFDLICWRGRCVVHPDYRAIRAPECDCERCWVIWNAQFNLEGFARDGANRLIKRYK